MTHRPGGLSGSESPPAKNDAKARLPTKVHAMAGRSVPSGVGRHRPNVWAPVGAQNSGPAGSLRSPLRVLRRTGEMASTRRPSSNTRLS